MPTPIRVILADDHSLFLEGLQALLSQQTAFEVVATAKNGREAIRQLENNTVDVLVLDIDMPELNGLETCAELQKRGPTVHILLLSMHHEPALVQKAIAAGAKGYILKTAESEELLFALKQVAKGKTFYDTHFFVQSKPDQQPLMPASVALNTMFQDLTARETEIMRLIANGRSNAEIGSELFISPKTVDTHRTNLMRKLNVHNIASLTRMAIEAGLI
jgi:DNA-binding NarL/FixJ family response regulator